MRKLPNHYVGICGHNWTYDYRCTVVYTRTQRIFYTAHSDRSRDAVFAMVSFQIRVQPHNFELLHCFIYFLVLWLVVTQRGAGCIGWSLCVSITGWLLSQQDEKKVSDHVYHFILHNSI